MIGAKMRMEENGSFRFLKMFMVAMLLGAVFHSSVSAQTETEAEVIEDEAVIAEAVVEEEVAEEEVADTLALLREDANILWTCLAAFLVFFMQAGFTLVETGFTRSKNACNIIMKNLMDFSVGSLAFWAVGFGLMFGVSSGYVGTSFFFFDGTKESGYFSSEGFAWSFLIFQTVFAATAATIVSGAVAERTKYIGYLAYSIAITVIVYPIFGSWCWNGLVGADDSAGWLEAMGFLDFAGSTVVHSIGGWAALAGAIVIGPRKGKFNKEGQVTPIPGHNIPLAALGVFILWLGWFGFNPGSTTALGGSMAYIAVTTNLAAAGGAIAAMFVSWILFKKPDVSFALNGALAGLVSITAGCDIMSPLMATLTGTIGGVLVVFSVLFFDKLKIDDPVGAVSVHGVCGAWGTLAIGLFSSAAGGSQLGIQALGVAAAFLWAFPVSFAIFTVIKMTVGLRASEEEEHIGLDISEHGMVAYSGIQ
ncbi:ammonium transporter [Thalassoglobus polymorphus]|uniref:Ammonium transporter n=1 Tax=Thalassoglobus polymorphus TaxID=2527994 RepID=A0A517QIK7_9PLAN|nr:ammonium transporter [Thalassoglobus polymorphus]QDT31480.1 Ammonium transporter NrgA [Thalassoglobus polymorphus]